MRRTLAYLLIAVAAAPWLGVLGIPLFYAAVLLAN